MFICKPYPLLAADALDLLSRAEKEDNAPLTVEHLRRFRYPLIVSPKLDGYRATRTDNLLTRSLKPVRNVFTRNYLMSNPAFFGMDGELIVGDPTASDVFQVSSSGVSSIAREPDFRYFVFDLIHDNLPFEQRYAGLRDLVAKIGDPRIVLVPHYTVHSAEEILEYESQFLEAGYEGIMLRYPNDPYFFHTFAAGKKSENRPSKPLDGFLIKLKRFEDDEARITGFYEEMHNANEAKINAYGNTERSGHQANMIPKGTLGGFLAESIGKFPGAEIRIGGGIGMTKKFRKDVWDNPEPWRGLIIKYKFQRQGVKILPRFGRFVGVRDPADM